MHKQKSNNQDTEEATIKQSIIASPVAENDNGDADTILTISTAETSAKACSIIEVDENQLKIQTNKNVAVHFAGNSAKKGHQQLPPEQNERSPTNLSFPNLKPSSSSSSTATAAKRKFSSICNITKWLSFQENIADLHHRKGRRLHGLQFPLHPLQLVGWLMLILFGSVTYSLLIPSFSSKIQGPLFGLLTGLYVVHIISHLTALLIDPADKELCRIHRNDRIIPEFDRTKHSHVIENGRCHLCNIKTSSQRTKHCSVCNKCVGKFDHHCKWLNHCIGARNYVAFLMCVISAVIATIIIVGIASAQIVLYYVQPTLLNCYWCSKSEESITSETGLNLKLAVNKSQSAFIENNYVDVAVSAINDTFLLIEAKNSTLTPFIGNNDTLNLNNETIFNGFPIDPHTTSIIKPMINGTMEIFNRISINDTIFLIFFGIIGLIAAIAAGLLLHLCFFHIYISILGLTTYEYIRNHRKSEDSKSRVQKSNNPNAKISTTLPKNDTVHFLSNPSKRSNKEYVEIYCCSGIYHPNASNPDDDHFSQCDRFKADPTNQSDLKMYCCITSLEYHQQRATKAYYICSLLQKQSSSALQLTGMPQLNDTKINIDEVDCSKTFHCFSRYSAVPAIRRVSAINMKADLISNDSEFSLSTVLNTNRAKSTLKYTEDCSFCTFQMRSSIKNQSKRISTPLNNINHRNQSNGVRGSAGESKIDTSFYHQCWRRMASAQAPNGNIDATNDGNTNENDNKHRVFSIDKVNYVNEDIANDGSVSNKMLNASRSSTRSTTKFRHMMRMISRFRQPRCNYPHNIANLVATDHIKQNQIRPLQLEIHGYGCQQQQSSNFCETRSERALSMVGDSSLETSCNKRIDSNAMFSHASAIRDDTNMTFATSNMNILPPALPPPTRRKISITTNLMEPAETMEFASNPLNDGTDDTTTTYFQRRFPTINNVYKRQRRKQLLRSHSPTLSPIHESGLSNPTSPHICRRQMRSTAVVPNKFSCEPLQKSISYT